MRQPTEGSQCRFVTTEDFRRIAESTSGKALGWFFDIYLRQPKLPVLQVRQVGREVTLRWKVPIGDEFPMPVEVHMGDRRETIVIPVGEEGFSIMLQKGEKLDIDPQKRILFEIKLDK